MTETSYLRPQVRFSGELNMIRPWIRQRYICNLDKQDRLIKIKNEILKDEYYIAINNLGKSLRQLYSGDIPDFYVHPFWINNLHVFESYDDRFLIINYKEDDEWKYVPFQYDGHVTLDQIKSSDICQLVKLTCKLVDIRLPESLFNKQLQEVTLYDELGNTIEAVVYGEYVDVYKWKYGCEVNLIGCFINPFVDIFPNFIILAMDYTEEYANETMGLIDEDASLRNSPEYDYWRSNILKKDKKCQCCGSNKSLEVHHIFSYKYSKDLRIHPENGIVLCHQCHTKYHGLYGKIATPRNLIKFIQEFSPIKTKKKKG